jgi:hypothetical protein
MRVLRNSPVPLDVENVRLNAGMKNWESAKSILLEMVLEGAVQSKRTSKSWLFWITEASSGTGG